ncbi:MAG: multicopper oxidase domain-containing protein [Metallibacterium scheffleri]
MAQGHRDRTRARPRHVPKGAFVFHCHMLAHEDRGMMGMIRVE